jgi:hypothetical protein
LFLFENSDVKDLSAFTEELLVLDSEFPASRNKEELRLMAGIVMVTTFGENSRSGDAFALGLRAALYPGRKVQVAQPEILAEAETYLLSQAENQRPDDFKKNSFNAAADLKARFAELQNARQGEDGEKENDEESEAEATYQYAIGQAIDEADHRITKQVARLAEEVGFLWWVLGEYSTSLKRKVTELNQAQYALVAGAEAADRTHILPQPRSAGALLARALKPCKTKKKSLTLVDFLSAANHEWRTQILRRIDHADSVDLVPIVTGLAKTGEFSDAATAVQVLPKLCLGIDTTEALSPLDVAESFYVELLFLKALTLIKD